MTAQEFGEWMAWFQMEEQLPVMDRMRHAQLLAAAMNGGVTRQAGGLFRASELVRLDPWAIEDPAPQAAPPTFNTLAAQVAQLNARRE